MFDAQAYQKEYQLKYRQARSQDQEKKKKYNERVCKHIMNKYHNDPEWKEAYNQKRKERYAMKKSDS
jgi:hypothetical protein